MPRPSSDVSAAPRVLLAVLLGLTVLLGAAGRTWAQSPIVTENLLPGNDASEWDVSGYGDPTIQGFATDISVNQGETVHFKINSDATAYHIDIYRLGYYAGKGARLVGTGVVTAALPQAQPDPLSDASTGLIDCGNWAESAHWDVPASAVSGIYIARLVRNDTQGASHIIFVVRDDASHSDLFFQTSDGTWQAYNVYGGNSLYVGSTSYPNGHAAKVSYNRPFWTRAGGGGGGVAEDGPFNAEYPMIRWLEANGYDVTYTTDVDSDRRGNLIQQHQVFMSVGHDEYWSGAQRANVTAARDAGVHLAFFSGNEIYWKTRYEPSTDGSNTPYRTLVCYKEGTLGENACGGKCDPLSDTWTGLWRDGCSFTPTADGCRPENALSGQISWDETQGAVEVPDTYKNLRFWRNTSVATLGLGETATLTPNSLGHEWDWEQYPDRYPAGRVVMSSTTLNGRTHHLSLYRHASGALVFGAGTVQWSWGLDANHDRGGSVPSSAMQQATVNLLADMGSQPASLQVGLVAATQSSDHAAPISVITAPTDGAQIPQGTPLTISGTASDAAGVVAGVEVSVDGGTTWHPAGGTADWTYAWTPTTPGSVTIKSRAFDDSGNLESVGTPPAPNAISNTVVVPIPATEGPGGPILVVSAAAHPFSRYFVEILRAEGLNEFTAMDISLVNSTVLNAYDVVILGEMPLDASQVAMLETWTNAGGVLIAMRPDAQLAGLLGLTPAGGTLANAYLLVNTASGAGAGIVGQTIQYHGTADRYTLSGATSVATLYADASTPTANPAVTTHLVGSNGGQAVAFTYDLARSVVYTRQGNPAWAGQKRDGQNEPIRSDDLFFGNAAGDPQPDWVDLNKVAIPQADEQQRLLANLILQGNLHKKPLPRFWYLPKGLKAAVVMTGDNHGDTGMQPRFDIYRSQSPAQCSVDDWECVRATGYEYVGTAFTDAQAQFYSGLGFEVSLHVNTGCSRTTSSEYDAFVTDQLAGFASTFPNLPAPSTNRVHCVAWSDWSSVAEVQAAHGIRFDTAYYYWPASWIQNRSGMFTGSGIPMRFAKLDGGIIDCYQAATQMPDESGESFPQFCNELLDRALGAEGYYGVFTANMHFDVSPHPGSDAIVASAQAHGVPVVSAKQMLTWLDGRNGSSFGNMSWDGGTLSFTIAVAAGSRNLRAMLPTQSTIGPLSSLTRNGAPVATTTEIIKGIAYTFFPADPGSYAATYQADTTPPAISAVTATPHADETVTIAWSTDEASDSRVDYGTSAGSLTSNASDPSLVASHVVTLSGLAPSTIYYYRVTSADVASNAATSPNPPASPLSFTTPDAACFVDDVTGDFAAGTLDANTAVVTIGNGEIILRPAAGAEFTALPPTSEWDSFAWDAGGGSSVSGGQLAVDGARFNTEPASTTYGPGTTLEFVATFGASAYQHVGLGGGNDVAPNEIFNTTPMVAFSTGSSGTNVITRVWPPAGGGFIDFTIPLNLIGTPHRYRIDWAASSLSFSVDGALVHTEPVAIPDPMRPAISDFAVGGPAIHVDWIRATPYAAGGTFASRVFDSGATTSWTTMVWNADTPAGTSLAMAYRAGNTASPDGSWTSFTPVASSGGAVGVHARYVQYRAELATTIATATPVVRNVSLTCCTNATPPSAISDLAAQRLVVDSNTDGTRQIRLTFTTPVGATSVEVYRARFGNYPEYDNPPNAGSVPPVPSYPPDAGRWSLTGVTASGQADEVTQRDQYYYVAFSKDACGNASAASNPTGGTLNYVLGDVHDGQPGHECSGNNVVFMEDLSYLGSNYGVTLEPGDARDCLDVGPTVTGSTNARPLTDGVLNFEDLIIFGLDFSSTPLALTAKPAAAPTRQQVATQDALSLEAPGEVAAGEEFTARLRLSGSGAVSGISAQLAWDATVAEPVAVSAGELAVNENAMVLSGRAGNVDAVRLGGGFTGTGVLAEVRFRARVAGNPSVRIATMFGRDAANHSVSLGQPLAVPGTALPAHTGIVFAAPNPFGTRLAIQLAVSHAQHVRVQVYDLAGRVVNTLLDGREPAGSRVVLWDGRDGQGRLAAAGVYILKLDSAETQQTRRVQLVR